MTRTETARQHLRRVARATPFRPYAVSLENGDRVMMEHPENVAYDPTDDGRDDTFMISGKLTHWSSSSAITGVSLLDTGEPSSTG